MTARTTAEDQKSGAKPTHYSASLGALPEHSGKDKVRDPYSDKESVLKFLSKWKRAWERKDLDTYIKMYHPGFQSGTTDYQSFLKSKEKFFRKYQTVRVKTEQVQVDRAGEHLVVKFLQHFRGDNYRDKGWKSMVLVGGKDKGFQIVSEDWSAL
jgi:murein L,D-transpeptidase YafK